MKSKILSLLIFFILNIVSIRVKAQATDPNLNKFIESIFINFKYPELLRKNCIPTITLIKVELDKNGKIVNFDVSDSADMLFKVDLQIASKKFDTKSLMLFVEKFTLKNITILIPYFIHLSSKNCPSPLSPGDLNKYQTFSGIPLQGNRLYTDPIIAIEKDDYDAH